MDSLHSQCTPLKKKYDSCFNHWFEEYLALAAPSPSSSSSSSGSTSSSSKTVNSLSSSSTSAVPPPTIASHTAGDTNDTQRQESIRAKAAEYEKRCGDVWRAYRSCLETGLEQKDLKTLISEARQEFPLKKPHEVDMEP